MVSLGNYLNRGVQHFSLPAWISGYRYMKCVSSEQIPSSVEVLESASCMNFPLPKNVGDRNSLNKEAYPGYPFSLYSVPELEVSRAYLLKLENTKLLHCRDEWNDDFYALVTSENRSVIPPGIGYKPEHRKVLSSKSIDLDSAVWFGGMWFNNYFLWHTGYLCRLMRIIELGLQDKIILPERKYLKGYVRDTLDFLNIKPLAEIGPSQPSFTVRDLTVVIDNPYRGTQLRAYREKLFAQTQTNKPFRKIYVSRAKANYRRLVNEDVVSTMFKQRGWEIHSMEDYSYAQQKQLMSESIALAGLQGAGFGNIMFLPEGGHVLELSMLPSANFYALACAIGHHYWILEAKRANHKKELLYDDAWVDESSLENILNVLK